MMLQTFTRSSRLVALLCLLLAGTFTIGAQDDEQPTNPVPGEGRPILEDVYITTQDYVVLRAGPGQLFERLGVVPFNQTIEAVGRTSNGEWLQIAYEGALEPGAPDTNTVDGITYGWLSSRYLIWSGDILTLPVDGIGDFVPYGRLSMARILLTPESYIYVDGVDPSTQVTGLITEPTIVELTGRIGVFNEGAYFWLQFLYEGQYYWTGTWETGVPPGYIQVPDGAYIYSYGRLLLQLRQEIRRNQNVLNIISGRWRALDSGSTTTCNNIPDDAAVRPDNFQADDLETEPLYAAAVRSVEEAIAEINFTLGLFREVCADPERVVLPERVQEALASVNRAQVSLNFASTLIEPFERRDPLVGVVSP